MTPYVGLRSLPSPVRPSEVTQQQQQQLDDEPPRGLPASNWRRVRHALKLLVDDPRLQDGHGVPLLSSPSERISDYLGTV